MISCTVHQSKILGLHTWLLLSIAFVLDVSVVCLDMVVQLIMDILDLDMVVQLVVVFLDILDLDKVVQLVTDFLDIYYIQFV